MNKKILINLPTNLGDAMMCLPAVDLLKANYPKYKLSVIVSSITKGLINCDEYIDEVIFYNKHWPLKLKVLFIKENFNKYEIIVDFKNSILAILLGAKKRTPIVWRPGKDVHEKDRNILLIKKIITHQHYPNIAQFKMTDEIKREFSFGNACDLVGIACSSRSDKKMINPNVLKNVVIELLARGERVVVFGLPEDVGYYAEVLKLKNVIDLVGKTKLCQVANIIRNNLKFMLSVDSGLMHLTSYLNVPLVVLFGGTDSKRYGPWSEGSVVIESKNRELTDISANEIIKVMLTKGLLNG